MLWREAHERGGPNFETQITQANRKAKLAEQTKDRWADKATEYGAGLAMAVELGWLWKHESGTYVKFTQAGAALFCLTAFAAANLYFWWPIESSRSGIRTPQRGSFKQFWVADDEFDPELPHYPLDIIRLKATAIRVAVAELTHARDPGVCLARVWGKVSAYEQCHGE